MGRLVSLQHVATRRNNMEDKEIAYVPKKKEVLDLGSSFTRELSEDRFYRGGWANDWREMRCLQVQASKRYRRYLLEPSVAAAAMPESMVTSRYCHTALNKSQVNKSRCPVTQARWTPEGRWLMTGAQNGEFTLWNGLDFTFNRVIQGHDKAIKSICWSRSSEFMVSGDHEGRIRVWNSAIALMKEVRQENGEVDRAHKESIRGLSFSPTDSKLTSCGDDLRVRIWDFGNQIREERSIESHDVRSIDWHPTRGLLVMGSRDHSCKLWSPKDGKLIRAIPGHKQTVNVVKWHPTCEDMFLSASRDCMVRLHDVRMLRNNDNQDVCVLQWKAHDSEINAAAWHPIAPDLLVTGGHDGSLAYWMVGGNSTSPARQAYVPTAHEGAIWDVDWNPLGHMLATGSNDHTAKFWSRPRPGDMARDVYGGYNKDRGLSEITDMLSNSQSLPLSREDHEREFNRRSQPFVKRQMADSMIPGVGKIGEENASRLAGLLLATPTSDAAMLQSTMQQQLLVQQQQQPGSGDHQQQRRPMLNAVPERAVEDLPRPRYRGTVRRWDEKGFGFIAPFDTTLPTNGIFAHATSILTGMGSHRTSGESEILTVGALVEFGVERAENRKTKDMQIKAVDIIEEQYFSKTLAFDGVEQGGRRSTPAAATTTTAAAAPPQQQHSGNGSSGGGGGYPPSTQQPTQSPAAAPMHFNPEYLAGVRYYLENGQQQLVEANLAQHGLRIQDIYPFLYPAPPPT
ncbi:hypothetical protein BASA81_003137 [Batrachochytrium salamandrivorans]|nr:hypothetical protein BASA81_003137 [Batrachochytrium salamandrivorans]